MRSARRVPLDRRPGARGRGDDHVSGDGARQRAGARVTQRPAGGELHDHAGHALVARAPRPDEARFGGGGTRSATPLRAPARPRRSRPAPPLPRAESSSACPSPAPSRGARPWATTSGSVASREPPAVGRRGVLEVPRRSARAPRRGCGSVHQTVAHEGRQARARLGQRRVAGAEARVGVERGPHGHVRPRAGPRSAPGGPGRRRATTRALPRVVDGDRPRRGEELREGGVASRAPPPRSIRTGESAGPAHLEADPVGGTRRPVCGAGRGRGPERAGQAELGRAGGRPAARDLLVRDREPRSRQEQIVGLEVDEPRPRGPWSAGARAREGEDAVPGPRLPAAPAQEHLRAKGGAAPPRGSAPPRPGRQTDGTRAPRKAHESGEGAGVDSGGGRQ